MDKCPKCGCERLYVCYSVNFSDGKPWYSDAMQKIHGRVWATCDHCDTPFWYYPATGKIERRTV